MDSAILENTLHYTFYPEGRHSGLPSYIRETVSAEKYDSPESKLIKHGEEALRDAIVELVTACPPDATHLLPLSGGLDSRIVLGLLTDYLDREQIQTVTIGLPVGWDFELGQQVAAAAGVQNTTVDPTSWTQEWTPENVLEFAATLEYPNRILGGHLQHVAREKAIPSDADNVVVWTGFLGEIVAGRHLSMYDTTLSEWSKVCADFAS